MTKLRTPLSWADAATRVCGLLTNAVAAQVVGKSERLVRAWCDPDSGKRPSLDQAKALDCAYRAGGGEDTPFLDAFAFQVDVTLAKADACRMSLAADVAQVAREIGDAISAALALVQSNASPRDVLRAFAEAQQADGAVTALLRRLAGFLPAGTGPANDSAGGAQ